MFTVDDEEEAVGKAYGGNGLARMIGQTDGHGGGHQISDIINQGRTSLGIPYSDDALTGTDEGTTVGGEAAGGTGRGHTREYLHTDALTGLPHPDGTIGAARRQNWTL